MSRNLATSAPCSRTLPRTCGQLRGFGPSPVDKWRRSVAIRFIVTYDRRLLDAAKAVGLPVAGPGQSGAAGAADCEITCRMGDGCFSGAAVMRQHSSHEARADGPHAV